MKNHTTFSITIGIAITAFLLAVALFQQQNVNALAVTGSTPPGNPNFNPGPHHPIPGSVFLVFTECSGTNNNHNVHCSVTSATDPTLTDINCIVPFPGISGGNNLGSCIGNAGQHFSCVIPPRPGTFVCARQ